MNIRDLWLRFRALMRPGRVEQELDEELAFHLERQMRKHLEAGLTATEARRRAHAEFGSTAFIEDECRETRGIAFFDGLFQDVRYAIRSFRRTPTFTLTAVGTIALGLGLNAAIFTIFNAYVLRPEAVRDPESLYSFTWSLRRAGNHSFNFREYEDFRRRNEVFEDVLARRTQVLTRILGQDVRGQLVTGNYFQLLGVGTELGRTLTPSDSTVPGHEAVVVLSDSLWRRLFDRDGSIIGRKILINGYPCEVVGIAREGFSGLDVLPPDFWAPLTLSAQLARFANSDPANPELLEVIGRLKTGVTESQARAALVLWAQQATAERSDDQKARQVLLESRATSISFSPRLLLLISPLLAAFALVLLIACANVANLMLARALARQREIAIRLSLGASRSRVVRQLITESFLLALTAAAVGFVISVTVLDLAMYSLFSTMPSEVAEAIRVLPLKPDLRLVVFLAVAAVMTTLVFGCLPAFQATRTSLVQSARGTSARGIRAGRARHALLVLQISAAALLLIGAGVLLRGTIRIAAQITGFRTADVVEVKIDERSRPALVQALKTEPLVESLAATWPDPPLNSSSRPVTVTPGVTSTLKRTTYQFTSPEYFHVFAIEMLNGRPFTEQEAISKADVVIVSESAARLLWPGEHAIGQPLRVVRDEGLSLPPRQPRLPVSVVHVIGVVRDVSGYTEETTGIYLPISPLTADTTLIVRVHGDPEAARRRLDETLTNIDPRAVQRILKMQTFVALQTYPSLVAFWVAMALGTLALVLTLSGIYGVVSYLVEQRTREIGIRMALGANAGAVVWMVVAQSIRLVAIGLTAGALLAWAASKAIGSTRFLSRFLTMIDPRDPVAYVGSLLVVLAACILAASVPALRAARIDPIATLRHD